MIIQLRTVKVYRIVVNLSYRQARHDFDFERCIIIFRVIIIIINEKIPENI